MDANSVPAGQTPARRDHVEPPRASAVATPGGPAHPHIPAVAADPDLGGLRRFLNGGLAAQAAADAAIAQHADESTPDPVEDSAWQYEQHAALVNFAARVKLARDRGRRGIGGPADLVTEIDAALTQLDEQMGWPR